MRLKNEAMSILHFNLKLILIFKIGFIYSYSLNYLNFFRTEIKLKFLEKFCKNKDFSKFCLPSQRDNILKINQFVKSEKTPCIIYSDLEFLFKKIEGFGNNPEKSPTIRIGEHIPCRYSMSNVWTFNTIGNKYSLYHGEGCIRELASNVINFEKKKILPLTMAY